MDLDWIDAYTQPPVKFGLYFCKCDGVKMLLRLHEVEAAIAKYEKVLWLMEPEHKFIPAPISPNAYQFMKDIEEPLTSVQARKKSSVPSFPIYDKPRYFKPLASDEIVKVESVIIETPTPKKEKIVKVRESKPIQEVVIVPAIISSEEIPLISPALLKKEKQKVNLQEKIKFNFPDLQFMQLKTEKKKQSAQKKKKRAAKKLAKAQNEPKVELTIEQQKIATKRKILFKGFDLKSKELMYKHFTKLFPELLGHKVIPNEVLRLELIDVYTLRGVNVIEIRLRQGVYYRTSYSKKIGQKPENRDVA